ncbi:gluconate:H+ symporter [Microbacterium sp.]|uniref:GntP family permease n=1 Tax=Microbacterium sp. TaxID=51671 RepID=UPI0032214426
MVEPAYSTGVLLLIAVAAIALLLFMIMKLKIHAFVSLIFVSLVTAIAAGIPVYDPEGGTTIATAMTTGFAGVLGSVALLVGFGVMLGRLLEATGGAQVLADTLVSRFGEKRAPFALGVAALFFGFPIFFDAGLVIFLPILFTVARRFGGSLLLYGIPTAAAFAAMHAIMVPHPGPVAATEILGGDLGITLLAGIPVAVIGWFLGGYLIGTWQGRRVFVKIPDAILGEMNELRGPNGEKLTAPSFGHVLLVLLLPLILISGNTILNTLITAGVIADDAEWARYVMLLGTTPIALLISVLFALFTLSPGRFTLETGQRLMDGALGPVCGVILITGAGGMFGAVLRASGIGEALTDSLSGLGLPLIVQAFVVAAALRVAQGSATVALTATAGLIAADVAAAGLSTLDIAALVFAIAGGATVLSHVNDSGFWLVSKFFGMDLKTTLKTWTVMETILGTVIFLLAWVLWLVV